MARGDETRPSGAAQTWGRDGAPLPVPRALGLWEWLRIARRGLPILVILALGLALLMLLRLVEWPLHGARRPWTPFITQTVCRLGLRCIGLPLHVTGKPLAGGCACVANHASWLDIFVLNAGQRVTFVSKAEVAAWPGIGWLARATGTVFIRRDRAEAAAQTRLFEDRLAAGEHLLFFPEGTSTDGRRVLPFVPTLFQAFLAEGLRETLLIQPITVIYTAPPDLDPRHYGWWGDMEFGAHALQILATPRQGRVTVQYHAALPAAAYPDRKALARAAQAAVAAPFAQITRAD